MTTYPLSPATKRIRRIRTQRKLSQTEVASVLGVAQRTYSDYERGRTRLNVLILLQLARFYDVSMDYISGASAERLPFPRR